MALANVIAPPPTKETGTCTEYPNQIKWSRIGNTVNVSVDGFVPTVNTNINITGLPKPYNGQYQYFPICSGGQLRGYLEYNDSVSTWRVYGYSASAGWGSGSYLTDGV